MFPRPLPSLLGALLVAMLPLLSSGLCPSQCSCDEADLNVSCARANLTVVPIFLNPGIRQLSVAGNRIQKLEGALGFYGALERLDLSRNEFKHVGKRQFASQKKLQLLDLSNNFLTSLHGGSFSGLGAAQTLDLSHNVLSRLENDTFRGLDSLVELRLKHNLLAEIEPLAFSGLSRLRVLHLESNRLSTLSPEWMSSMGSLRFLYASSNEVADLPEDAFKPLQALRVVTLGKNRITENLNADAFRGARSVDTLDLDHNLLGSVPSDALARMPQLARLDLSGNPVTSLDRSSFRDLHLLQSLKLSNMSELTSVSGLTFMDNLKLRSLEMEGNPSLDPLPWGVFSFNSALEELSVRHNQWSTLSPHQVPQHSLKRLRLGGLPLNCNCSVVWLWEIYRRGENSTVELDEVRCESVAASPKEDDESGAVVGGEAGDPLAKMAREQLICQDWSRVLLAVSVSVLVTVFFLVVVSLLVYKCRSYRLKRRGGGSCLHIKDDTMVYKSTLHHVGHHQQQQQHMGTPMQSPYLQHYYANGDPAYKAVSAGGYSPTNTSGSNEPFYEVPKYVTTKTLQLSPSGEGKKAQQGGASASKQSDPKSSSSSASNSASSKYSSSGYIGSELWEAGDLFGSPAHCYLNPAGAREGVGPGHTATIAATRGALAGNYSNVHGSPQSTSTGLSSTGSSSNASSTSSSGLAARPGAFYSPSTMRTGGQHNWHQMGSPKFSASGFSPVRSSQQSPPSPAPRSSSKTLMLHQFASHQQQGGGSPMFPNKRSAKKAAASEATGSGLRGGGGGVEAASPKRPERSLYV